jgi:hypothetical protein
MTFWGQADFIDLALCEASRVPRLLPEDRLCRVVSNGRQVQAGQVKVRQVQV